MNTWTEYMLKQAAGGKVLADLQRAKMYSDANEYAAKHSIIRRLVSEHPSEFIIDSRRDNILGIRHVPTGFQMHVPQLVLMGTPLILKPQADRPYYVGKSAVHGRGAFALRPFAAGEEIGQAFKPKMKFVVEAQVDVDKLPGGNPLGDAQRTDLGRFTNHAAEEANIGYEIKPDGSIAYKAKRSLRPGEELLINYDEFPWQDTAGSRPKAAGQPIQYPFQLQKQAACHPGPATAALIKAARPGMHLDPEYDEIKAEKLGHRVTKKQRLLHALSEIDEEEQETDENEHKTVIANLDFQR